MAEKARAASALVAENDRLQEVVAKLEERLEEKNKELDKAAQKVVLSFLFFSFLMLSTQLVSEGVRVKRRNAECGKD